MATIFTSLMDSCTSITLARSRNHSESAAPDRMACPPSPLPLTGRFFNRARPLSIREHTVSSPLLLPKTRAIAVDSHQENSSQSKEKGSGAGKYCFVVANAKFLLDEEEHFKEVLFERLRHLRERQKEHDFWLVVEPKFLDKFPSLTNRLKRPAVALVSTDAAWITFVKLKLDRVLCAEYEAESLQEALACYPTDLRFPPPKKWNAPYPKYEFGWWERFLPPKSEPQK